LIKQLSEQYGGTGYDQLAALASARLAMDGGDFDTAASALQQLHSQKLTVELKALVSLRLAKVQFAQQNFAAALTSLSGDMQKFAAQAAELRGDVLAAQGDNSGAAAAYEEAQSLAAGEEMLRPSPLLRIKIESVASATPGDNA
jgi:predicted negative regulator of RcsB-dependent stress response